MGPSDFAIIPLTTLSTGFVTAMIGCTAGLSFTGSTADVPGLLRDWYYEIRSGNPSDIRCAVAAD